MTYTVRRNNHEADSDGLAWVGYRTLTDGLLGLGASITERRCTPRATRAALTNSGTVLGKTPL